VQTKQKVNDLNPFFNQILIRSEIILESVWLVSPLEPVSRIPAFPNLAIIRALLGDTDLK
jgi:hypothetical protein